MVLMVLVVLLLLDVLLLFLGMLGQLGQLFLVQWFSIDQHFSVESGVLVGRVLDRSQLSIGLLNAVLAVQFVLVAMFLAALRHLALGILDSVLELVVRLGDVIDRVAVAVLVLDVDFVRGTTDRAAELGVRESHGMVRVVVMLMMILLLVLTGSQCQQSNAGDGLEW